MISSRLPSKVVGELAQHLKQGSQPDMTQIKETHRSSSSNGQQKDSIEEKVEYEITKHP